MKSIRGVVGFVRAVEAGSFAGAAKKLGVTPVAVSKNVQRLERQLGVRLLQRSTRKLSLTQEGRAYYERCCGPLRELENAQSVIAERGKSPTGALKVTCLSPFGRVYVLPLIPDFSRRYPAIELELHLDDAVTDMIAGGFDVGIRAGEARDGTMVMREVAPLHFVVCGAPSYLAERGIPLSVSDLSRHNCLRLRGRDSQPVPWRLGPGHLSEAPPITGNFLANDIPALVTAAVHGQGLVFAPLPFVLPLFRTGALRPVLPESVSQPARIFIHYASRKHLAARVKAFVNFMLEHLRGHPDLISDPQNLLAPFVNPRGSAGAPGKRIV
ncbi:LysR family transcriptional regulator [Bradyrhizobium sp. sBnM-33]|uniref:LysR family transcriptional regulator n=1 Tax=Bradyrhizobium sp. sBnM-33 TaxID=2831780 RepID=UPI001BCC5A43|nr:LysR family transcriptional regulator [Bradyrhizobium sp. sBnM-33]WOH48002.1 LysR family transcriptional regulator [Bradyrhizobium sp. sBnM-33]